MTTLLEPRPATGPLLLDSLSEREHQVLRLVTLGLSNRTIAERLHVEEVTVDSHMGRIFTKLGLVPDARINRRVRVAVLYLRYCAGRRA